VEGALSGATNLDGLLTDRLQQLLEPALGELVADLIGQTQFDQLAQAAPANRAAVIDGYLAGLSNGVEALPSAPRLILPACRRLPTR
jgi:hypothetical protein